MRVTLGKIVESFDLPEEWIEDEVSPFESGDGMSFYYHHTEDPDIRICYFARHETLNQDERDNLFSILQGPPHKITAGEWVSLRSVVSPACNFGYFVPHESLTRNINGRTVICVRGMWKETQHFGYLLFCVFGAEIHTIYFVAPPDLFERFLPTAKKSLESLNWSSSVLAEKDQ